MGEFSGEGRDVPDGEDGDVVACLRAGRVIVEDHEGGEGWGLG